MLVTLVVSKAMFLIILKQKGFAISNKICYNISILNKKEVLIAE